MHLSISIGAALAATVAPTLVAGSSHTMDVINEMALPPGLYPPACSNLCGPIYEASNVCNSVGGPGEDVRKPSAGRFERCFCAHEKLQPLLLGTGGVCEGVYDENPQCLADIEKWYLDLCRTKPPAYMGPPAIGHAPSPVTVHNPSPDVDIACKDFRVENFDFEGKSQPHVVATCDSKSGPTTSRLNLSLCYGKIQKSDMFVSWPQLIPARRGNFADDCWDSDIKRECEVPMAKMFSWDYTKKCPLGLATWANAWPLGIFPRHDRITIDFTPTVYNADGVLACFDSKGTIM